MLHLKRNRDRSVATMLLPRRQELHQLAELVERRFGLRRQIVELRGLLELLQELKALLGLVQGGQELTELGHQRWIKPRPYGDELPGNRNGAAKSGEPFHQLRGQFVVVPVRYPAAGHVAR